MEHWELKADLGDKALSAREKAMKFAEEVLRPTGKILDRLNDPRRLIADTSELWTVIRQYRQLELHHVPAFDEDPDFSRARPLIFEVLGSGDAGLAMALHSDSIPFEIAAISEVPALQKLAENYFKDDAANFIGCWIDIRLQSSESIGSISDDLIIQDYKSRNIVNGSIATHALAHITFSGKPNSLLALISLNQPGIARFDPVRTMGMRAANQCCLRFNDVTIATDSLIRTNAIGSRAFASMHSGVGQIAVGLGQSALEQAIGYANDRIQGGVPIINHNNIKLKIFNMNSMLQSSRAFARSVTKDHSAEYGNAIGEHAVAIRAIATRTAARLSSEAIQIFGGPGLMKMNSVEKMMRDAAMLMTIHGTNDELALGALRN